MQATVEQIYRIVDELAPFESQEAWDNSGLLAGRMDSRVEKVLVCLDVTVGAIEEAKRKGCQLIVSHHPILFHGRKNLREEDPEGRLLCALIRSGLAHIAAHTNLDGAPGGVNEVLAEIMGLSDPMVLPGGLRAGALDTSLAALAERAGEVLGGVVRTYGRGDRRISRLCVCGGAGGSFWESALLAGCDCYLTGEIRHSDALDAVAAGLTLLEAGHYATERPAVKQLRNTLQNRLDALQYRVVVFESAYEPF
ncbi:MAG: Nif3-like dinuclear metal center hexameric protein [Candidatus Excrementavichristensenella sp.]|jgi:dinuclear metal center YbgI/SA1388 family protein